MKEKKFGKVFATAACTIIVALSGGNYIGAQESGAVEGNTGKIEVKSVPAPEGLNIKEIEQSLVEEIKEVEIDEENIKTINVPVTNQGVDTKTVEVVEEPEVVESPDEVVESGTGEVGPNNENAEKDEQKENEEETTVPNKPDEVKEDVEENLKLILTWLVKLMMLFVIAGLLLGRKFKK